MAQKPRKEPGKAAAKKAPAKKAAPRDAVPTPEQTPPAEETPSPQTSPPEGAATGDAPAATTPEPSSEGTVVDSGSSSRTNRTDTVDDGERRITTTTVESRHATREYEHGRRVEETVSVTTSHRERIPMPYAGPISTHPAPVG